MGSNGDTPRSYSRWAFDVVVVLAMMLVPEHVSSTLKSRQMGVVSEQGRRLLGVALAQWRSAACRGDDRWNEAFATLAEVLKQERYNDVRLYMHQLSDDAAALFFAYEQEHFHE